MKNDEFREIEMAFYRSGCHEADFIFRKDGIAYKEMDETTGCWPDYSEFDMTSKDYEGLAPFLWNCWKAAQNADWLSCDAVVLENGAAYQRYRHTLCHKDGGPAEAWVWAMQGSGSPIDIVTCGSAVIAFILTRRDRCNVFVVPGYEALTPLKLWEDPLLSAAEYLVEPLGTFHVEMRDGIKLATEVWLPSPSDKGDRFPSILIRTPYGRLSNAEFWKRFVKRGYALVIQDVRGREDSEGEWIPYQYEQEDGSDTLDWLAGRPWSDGSAGMTGASYLGHVQWDAAASGNPHLKAVISMVTSGPPFIDVERKGGIRPSGTLAWTFMMADRRKNEAALHRDDWDQVLGMRPIRDIPRRALGRSIPFWDAFMAHPHNDAFWQKGDWTLHGHKVNVPSIIISGWYDDNGMGSTAAWEMNEKNGRENQKLIFGPWFHQFNSTREIHGVRFGSNAIRYDLDVLCLKWFDRFLKGIDNGAENEPAVQYYMVGNNTWEHSEKWPPENVSYQNFYFHSSGNARTDGGDGFLSVELPGEEPHDGYVFDPEDPAPFLMDISENELNVPENYKDVDMREDVLVYTSAVLEKDVTISGNINGVLFASSSAKDTDWLIRLEDVDEAGNAVRLTDGILRARYRKSFEKPELLKPGVIERYDIRMAKISNTFVKGHRIRVTVTSGAKNLAFPNHNTGDDPTDDAALMTAAQKIYHDGRHPSHVVLPVMPAL